MVFSPFWCGMQCYRHFEFMGKEDFACKPKMQMQPLPEWLESPLSRRPGIPGRHKAVSREQNRISSPQSGGRK
ncbi:MAG: hypothetical protein D6755_05600 [Anaerolineae bacterium]|nr:MAG: hypothetical protein D6755_05600 [Anaerolineae bacterium]